MFATTPEHAVHLLDEAFNRGDLDAIMQLYDPDAVVIPMPGVEARGTENIRSMYKRFAQPGASAHQIVTRVLEADNIALLLSRWTLTLGDAPSETFIATTVFRKGPDGSWKALIDNARGPSILDPVTDPATSRATAAPRTHSA